MKRFLLFILLISSHVSFGQILTFDFAGLSGNEVNASSNFNDGNLNSAMITRGAGVNASSNSNRFNSNSWTTSSSISTNDYLEFTITPNASVQFSVTSIDINHQRSGTGPTVFALRSSLDSYTSDLANFTNGDVTSTQSNSFSGLSISNQTSAITFRIYGYDSEGGSGSWGPGDFSGNDIIVNGSTAIIGSSVGFNTATSAETETDASFNASIPVTLTNYEGSQVDLSVAVSGGTAEMADYTLNTTSLSFTANGSMDVSIDINNDADTDNETIELTIAETSATGITITTAVHTITITDDDIPDVIINEILADPNSSTGDANGDGLVSTSQDEFVEIYNLESTTIDLSGWTIADGFGVRHTFSNGTNLPALSSIVVFGGGTPTGISGLTQTASSGQLGLNNGGDDIILANSSATTIDSYTYGGEGGNDESLARSPDFTGAFVQHSTITTNPVDFSPGKDNTDGSNLPIELTYFQVQKIKQQVLLSWETAIEINNDYMAIERSKDGRTFQEMGSIQGAGTSHTPQRYTYLDENPFTGSNYYRLRQVDFDGRATYHEVVAINMATANQVRMLPNPVNDFTTLQLTEVLETESKILIYDMMGKVVFETRLAAGPSTVDIDLSFLANGSYIIRLELTDSVVSERFVKQ